MESFSFEAIGTAWTIDLYEGTGITISDLSSEIHAVIERFDTVYSRFRPDSLVTQISKKKGRYTMPENAGALFDLYEQLYHLTDGAFTPLIGSLLEDAGYDASYSLQPKTLRRVKAWESTLVYTHPVLQMKEPALLDFGAAGKGYLVDLVAKVLWRKEIHSFCIDAGGDMFYTSREKKSLRIGLEHPEQTNQIIGIAHLNDGSICGSSGNRRKWDTFHHIIHPRTQRSPTHIVSVWVTNRETRIADALSTALFFVPPRTLQKELQFEYLILYADSHIEYSANFPGEFYWKDERQQSVHV